MHKIADKLTQVKHRVQQAARLSGRKADEITLLAVSKKQPVSAMEEAYAAGQRDFGENYLQEALEKMHAFNKSDVVWHFIGPIQGNKARGIAENFAWVHSVDRLKIAQKLSNFRPAQLGELNICLQINIDAEASKSGVSIEEAADLAKKISKLPGLKLRGLMAIPEKGVDSEDENNAFARLRQLLGELKLHHKRLADLDTLSMGMSADLEAAVWEGSTILRVGTDIFGPREQN